MSQEQAIQYLQQGIAAAKQKRNDEARRFLQNAIKLDPRNEVAWLWLSSVARDDKERLFCLRQLLAINPENEMAIKGLRALGVEAAPQAAAEPAAPKSAIPQPAPEKIAAAQKALDAIQQAATLHLEGVYPGVAWVHKTRNRAGERAAILLRLALTAVPILLIACILLAGGAFLASNPGVVMAPTWTPSYTPTVTPTPTPGFTPTPSPTPQLTYTPSPTFDPDLPHGDIFSELTPTPIYPRHRFGSRPLDDAVVRMAQGDYADVLPTLVVERENTTGRFDPAPYFYEAVALTELGDTERAERTLREGLDRSEDDPVLLAGMAYVFAALGETNTANRYATQALEGDPALTVAYLILAQNAIASGDYQAADRAIRDGLDVLPGDIRLWIQRGKLNLLRDQPDEAQYDAAVALYIDPTSEDAYLLRARADMARGDYGLAVLHLQEYLFFYPGSIQGWTLLGDARVGEGNFDLAMAAYSRALNTDEPLPAQIPAYLSRAALFMARHQYAPAYVDYDAVLSIDEAHVDAREGRASAAYRAARFGEAVEDVDILLDTDSSRNDLRLLKARALVDGANPRNESAYQQALEDALDILSGRFPESLSAALRPLAYEYRARVLYDQERYNEALSDVENALRLEESGSRHYLRGLIQEARGEEAEAIREYEWVRLWGALYNYPFLPDAIARLNALAGADS